MCHDLVQNKLAQVQHGPVQLVKIVQDGVKQSGKLGEQIQVRFTCFFGAIVNLHGQWLTFQTFGDSIFSRENKNKFKLLFQAPGRLSEVKVSEQDCFQGMDGFTKNSFFLSPTKMDGVYFMVPTL